MDFATARVPGGPWEGLAAWGSPIHTRDYPVTLAATVSRLGGRDPARPGRDRVEEGRDSTGQGAG